jgi:hypothetical protein
MLAATIVDMHTDRRATRAVAALTLAAGLLLLLAGCPSADPAGSQSIQREQFVQVVVELRQAEQQARTAPDFEERKAEILARHGVTEEELMQFAARHGSEVRVMLEIWDTIHARLAQPVEDSP